jgi:hypothetical protein
MTPQVPAIVAAMRAKYPGHVVILRASPLSMVYPPSFDQPIAASAEVVDKFLAGRMRNKLPLLVVEVVKT